jgi:endonuclease III
MSAAKRLALAPTIDRLRKAYGAPARPPTRDPWLAILRENAAYLVDDGRREQTFRALRERIGTSPAAILAARPGLLEQALEGGGMQPDRRAEKLRQCARLAQSIGLAALSAAARGEPDGKAARALLKRFPGIGEPGADKLMLLAGAGRTLALESNGLRAIVRLGLAPERKDLAARRTRAAAPPRAADLQAHRPALRRLRAGRRLPQRAAPAGLRRPGAQPASHSSTAAVSLRSSTTRDGPQARSCARDEPPVATASERQPCTRAHSTSCGVSPTITTCSAGSARPLCRACRSRASGTRSGRRSASSPQAATAKRSGAMPAACSLSRPVSG